MVGYIQPSKRRAKMPRVTVTLAMSVVMAMMLAANATLPLIALTITKLAAAVGLAKKRNSNPNWLSENPTSQAAAVESAGSITILRLLALNATWLLCRILDTESVAPMQMRASGNVSEAK